MSKLISKNTFISTVQNRLIAPGTNVIPADEVKRLSEDPFIIAQVKLGNYKLEETSVDIELTEDTADNMTDEDKVVLEVSEMNVKEAKELILGNDEYEGILNIKVLKALQNEDNRKGVQDAVETQIAILYAREDEDGNPE